MTQIDEKYVKDIVTKVALTNNLKKFKYSQLKFETIAQNYFGVLIPVIISELTDNEEVNIDVVLKLAPTDERYRVSGALTSFFLREIYVYSTVLKKYEDLQRSFTTYSKYVIPKCYYVCNEYCNEVIAMQNMCGEGYRPYISDMTMDLEHIKVSLLSLAKLHALSFIMKERDRKTYEEAEKICLPLSETSNKRFMEILLDRLQKALDKFENTDYVELLKKLKEDYVNLVEAATSSVQGTCICHGDIWKENILFKYENDKPISACLIDYQTARICCPAYDTLYLITCSTDAELRSKHFDELLNIYYQMFTKVIKEAELDSTLLYSLEMFKNDLNIVSSACFIVANTALWLSNGLQQEGHVKSKIVLTTEEDKTQAANRYKNIIKGIIDDYVSYGYFKM